MKKEQKLPQNLGHKPIISVNDYQRLDAFDANNVGAEALSIGKAIWDPSQISLKIWRRPKKRWSRLSEELPIHRNLDLSILFLAALSADIQENYPKSNLGEVIDRVADVQEIKDFYSKKKKFIEPRLIELKRLLDKIVIN